MAASRLQTKTLSSEKFVESCGAVLFDLSDLSDIKVCLIQHKDCGEWHLAKGRRNQGETRKDAAIREVMEETGYRCRLLPVTMPTRATPQDAHADIHDKVHLCENLTEPFMCHIRTLRNGKGTKFIWWFIAALEDDGDEAKLPGEEKWKPVFLPWHRAINTLTFRNDREVLQKAGELIRNTSPTLPSMYADSHQSNIVLENADILNVGSAPGGAMSKTARKRAAKVLKAIKRTREERDRQAEQEDVIKVAKGERSAFHDNHQTAPAAKPSREETKELRRLAKRQRRAARRVAEEEITREQVNSSAAQEAKTLQNSNEQHGSVDLDTNTEETARKQEIGGVRTAHQETVGLQRLRHRHDLANRKRAAWESSMQTAMTNPISLGPFGGESSSTALGNQTTVAEEDATNVSENQVAENPYTKESSSVPWIGHELDSSLQNTRDLESGASESWQDHLDAEGRIEKTDSSNDKVSEVIQ